MPLLLENDTTQDWRAIAEYLAGYGLIFDIAAGAKQFSGGAANLNFLVRINNTKAVLRRPPSGPLATGANDIAREFKVLSGLDGHYPYAPKAIHYCDDLSVIGVPFCISEFREGIPIQLTLPPQIATVPGIGLQLGIITLDALVALHAVDPVMAGLQDLGRSEGFLERQVEGWLKRASRVLSSEDAKYSSAIAGWLRQSFPRQRLSSVVHNDFKLDNMLINLETLTVNAVLDWDMCTIGDPLYDLTILLLYWGQENDNQLYRSLALMPFTANGWMRRREALDYYCARAGLTVTDEALKFYWILALYRLAVVMAQLLALYTSGRLISDRINETNAHTIEQDISNILHETALLCGWPLQW